MNGMTSPSINALQAAAVEAATLVEGQFESSDIWRVHPGDARSTGTFLESAALAYNSSRAPFLTATVTSPPYANIVDYGSDNQIGFSQTYDAYLAECKSIFEETFKWTKDDGSLWIVADSVVQTTTKGAPSRLIPLPFDLARVASDVGWTLRDVVVWRKDRTRPWSNRGRLRNGFEYVLYLVKSNDYKYHVDRLRDFSGLKSWWIKYPERHNPWGMAPDNVWDIPIPLQGSWASAELRHACPFPTALVDRILDLSTDEGDVVFDPFAGSGMVAAVSEAKKRLPLGTELNPHFVEAYERHVRPDVLEQYARESPSSPSGLITVELLLSLRVLKYSRELVRRLLRSGVRRPEILGIVVVASPFDSTPRTSSYAEADYLVMFDESVVGPRREEIIALANHLATVPPLSKFTLTARNEEWEPIAEPGPGDEYSVYRNGKTWNEHVRSSQNLIELTRSFLSDPLPPIVSKIAVSQAEEVQ